MEGGDRHEAAAQEEERQRQEVLTAAKFAHRKVKGALSEIQEALRSLDKVLHAMLDR